jgi:uncharacterized membrane protein YcaP (DUF421 family)
VGSRGISQSSENLWGAIGLPENSLIFACCSREQFKQNQIFMEILFFDSRESIIRTLIITILAYFLMVFLLRASGKRTLSKMNAFDFIVTVALGSALANVSLNKNVALADGALSFLLLIFLQYLISWLSVRFSIIKSLVTSQPVLLLYKGEILDGVRRKERITMEELHMAARNEGITSLHEIEAMVLETTGEITIISESGKQLPETLKYVKPKSKN